jgi:hypothetical protein
MYQECFLVVLVLVVVYLLYFNDTRILCEAFDGKKYKVVNVNNKINKEKADYLARIYSKAKKTVQHMYDNKLPTKEIANRTMERFNNCEFGETSNGEKSAAYTIGKGYGGMRLCIMVNGKFNNENDAFFVVLHELAHVMSVSYGHNDEFKQNFNFIVKLAVKLDLWKPAEYEKEARDYCGTLVTNSPCSGSNGENECTKDNLEFFYKESLLDYK